MLSEYLLPGDARFFLHYAKPLVATNSELFDLDEFEISNTSTLTDFNEAFMKFKNDSSAQYEMHPKFGRYVWDISDQWYQKWNVVLSMENMWSWTYNQTHLLSDMHTLTALQPWLDSTTRRHHIHPHHRLLLENICTHLFKWQKSNKILTDAGTFCLNTIPFFPPSWFTEIKMQSHIEEGDLLAPSYFAKFVPPYRLDDHVPERWDVVFLKGVNYDPTNDKFDIDPNLIVSIIPLYGLTVIFDETTGYSYLMMVMRKAAYGNLETNLQDVIPTDYHKPRRLALNITKAVKDLHWEYIHGNVHPRNILFNFDDTIGELVDATFVQPKHSVKSSTKSMNTSPSTSSNIITVPSTPPISPNESSSSLSKHLQFSPFINNENNNNNMNNNNNNNINNNNKIETLASTSTSSITTITNTLLDHSQYSSSSTCIQQKKKRNGISGRWPYVAPEVAQGITGPSTEADIYALGVIIWQLISRVTFPPNAPLDPWIFRIEPIPGVLPEWESLYMDCLSPYPESRPSAYMVYRRLEKMNVYTAIPTTQQQQQQQSYHRTAVTSLSLSSSSSITTCSAYNPSTHPLPIKQETLDYIHQRRKEIDEFMKEHKNQFSSPQQRLTKTKDNMILSASVTRSVNHGLENYPSLVHNMRHSSY